jgi:diguanylate cyclase (GGDEF)-like protein
VWRIFGSAPFFFAVATAAAAAGDATLDAARGVSDVTPACAAALDPAASWTVADAMAHDRAFRAGGLPAHVRADAFAPAALWFRCAPRAAAPGPWYVEAAPNVDRADVFFVHAAGDVERVTLGTLVPYGERAIPSIGNAAQLPEGALREGTLYFRLAYHGQPFGGFAIRPAAWEALEGRAYADDRLFPELLVIGAVAGLGLFNLILGLTIREPIYRSYALAMESFALYQTARCGAAWRWLWTNASVPYDATTYALYALHLLFVVLLARVFLDLPRRQPVLWTCLLLAYAGVVAVDAASVVVPGAIDRGAVGPLLEPAANVAFFLTIVASGVVAWRRRESGARTYTLACVGPAVGIVVAVVGDEGLIPANAWSDAAAAIGVAWEAMFLALALAERIVRLRGERDSLATVAFVDALTGVANRRAFELRIAQEWPAAERAQTPVSVILLDVDFFKTYNDGFGHLAGDAVLRRVARAISNCVTSPRDFVARYGGEEFIVLLPGRDASEARRTAEIIRATIEALRISHITETGNYITASAGAASAIPGPEATVEDLVAAADRALYVAKRAGRNRVEGGAPAPELRLA